MGTLVLSCRKGLRQLKEKKSRERKEKENHTFTDQTTEVTCFLWSGIIQNIETQPD